MNRAPQQVRHHHAFPMLAPPRCPLSAQYSPLTQIKTAQCHHRGIPSMCGSRMLVVNSGRPCLTKTCAGTAAYTLSHIHTHPILTYHYSHTQHHHQGAHLPSQTSPPPTPPHPHPTHPPTTQANSRSSTNVHCDAYLPWSSPLQSSP